MGLEVANAEGKNRQSFLRKVVHGKLPPSPKPDNGSDRPTSLSTYGLGEDPRAASWPKEPRTLRTRGWINILFATGDTLTVLIPAAFVVFAALAWHLDGSAVINGRYSLGNVVNFALQLGPTVFPMAFSAIAGTFTKSAARYSAERGAKLGNLELLLASSTVWGTFSTSVFLRAFNFAGIHLLFLWALSPLGSQATFRALSQGQMTTSNSTELFYMPTGAMSANQFIHGVLQGGDEMTQRTALNALYNAALLDANKASAQDPWGNIKIPWPKSGSSEIGYSAATDDYTALVGLPVVGIPTNGSFAFNLVFGFLELECGTVNTTSAGDAWWVNQLGYFWSPQVNSPLNASVLFQNGLAATGFFLDTNMPFSNGSYRINYFNYGPSTSENTFSKRNVLFGSRYYSEQSNYDITLRNCTIGTQYVNVSATCLSGNCQTTNVTELPNLSNLPITPLDSMEVSYNMFTNLPWATGDIHNGDSTATELFIRGAPTHALFDATFASVEQVKSGYQLIPVPSIANITDEVFARRLAIILNTYYTLSIAPNAFAGGLPLPSTNAWGPFGNGSTGNVNAPSLAPFYPIQSHGTVTLTNAIWTSNMLWISLLLATSITLLLVGIVGVVLKHLCQAPDIMGFVASMTYNNEYLPLPGAGGTLDAIERAYVLRNLRVRLGDVAAKDKVGRVALASAEGDGAAARLERGRMYI